MGCLEAPGVHNRRRLLPSVITINGIKYKSLFLNCVYWQKNGSSLSILKNDDNSKKTFYTVTKTGKTYRRAFLRDGELTLGKASGIPRSRFSIDDDKFTLLAA